MSLVVVNAPPSNIIRSEVNANIAGDHLRRRSRVMGPRSSGVYREPHSHKQKLSDNTEKAIIKHATRYIEHNFPVRSKGLMVIIANAYLNQTQRRTPENERNQVAEGWHKGLFQRHRDFEQLFSEAREQDKLNVPLSDSDAEKARLFNFMNKLEGVVHKYRISNENVYAVGDLGYVTTVKGENQPMTLHRPEDKTRPEKEFRPYASVIQCLSHRIRSLPPYVIVKNGGLARDEFHSHTRVAFNQTGWAERPHAMDWLIKFFEPQTRPSPQGREPRAWRLLLLDAYQFPVSPEFESFCWERRIVCLSFPRRTQKTFNPLHRGVFDSMGTSYAEHMRQKLWQSGRESYSIEPNSFVEFIKHQLSSHERLTEARDAWTRTCLFPLDRETLSNRLQGEQPVLVPDDSASSCARASNPPEPSVVTTRNRGISIMSVEYVPPSPQPSQPARSRATSDKLEETCRVDPGISGNRPANLDVSEDPPSKRKFLQHLDAFEGSSPRSRKRLRDALVSDYTSCFTRAQTLAEVLKLQGLR